MKIIKLNKDRSAMIDDCDYNKVNKFRWYVSWNGYAMSNIKGRQTRMHRLILGLSNDKRIIDHVDGNKLNNTRSNLRFSDKSTNGANRNKTVLNKSGYKGVHFDKINRNWRAMIRVHGKSKHIGSFSDVYDAALAYNRAALAYFGEFARLNTICN